MTHLRAAVFACLAFSTPVLGLAQEPEPEEGDDIVVTGQVERPTSGEVRRQAREITHGTDLLHTPLPRFEDRLCPGIIGMKPEFAALMIDRIRYHAQQLDMWLGDDTACRANLIIAFVENGQVQLADLVKRQPELFLTMSTADRRELLAEEGPVRVWTTTQQRTRDGMAIARRDSLDNPPVAAMWSAHSRIYVPVREDITQVVVLFDMSGVKGKSLVQLADYATMRGLARTRPVEDGQALDTILALFDPGGSGPAELTSFDRAYLASLYDGIPNLPGAARVGGVSRQLRQQASAEAQE